jgi:hypothetical protein
MVVVAAQLVSVFSHSSLTLDHDCPPTVDKRNAYDHLEFLADLRAYITTLSSSLHGCEHELA